MEETADKSADEKQGGVSDAEILELIERLDKAQVAERINALGVRRLISLQ